MGRLASRAIVPLLGMIALVALFSGSEDRSTSKTSFGRVPGGFGGAFELLAELGLPVERSYAAVSRLSREATVWWIAPRDLCKSVAGDDERTEPHREARRKIAPPCLDPTPWLVAGGTGVIFLDDRAASSGKSVGPVRLPARERRKFENVRTQIVEGELAEESHWLRATAITTFTDLGTGWSTTATLDGRPFIIERAVGSGRLVLIADTKVLRNAWLDRGDAAPLVVDLVRRFGVPAIDERAHGLGPPRNAFLFLARSAALPFFAGALLLAVAFAWSAAALPRRGLAEPSDPRPTLAAFVASMADLYARTRDQTRVLALYREATAARLRRRFTLPPETSIAALVERLRRRGADAESLALLSEERPVTGEAALHRAFGELDALADGTPSARRR